MSCGGAREWLETRTCVLPDDQDLIGELTVPKYSFTPEGKIKVESKDEMKGRAVPSAPRHCRARRALAAFGTAYGAANRCSSCRAASPNSFSGSTIPDPLFTRSRNSRTVRFGPK